MGIQCAWFGHLNVDWSRCISMRYLKPLPRTFRHNRSTRQNNAAMTRLNWFSAQKSHEALCFHATVGSVQQNDRFSLVFLFALLNKTGGHWVFTHDVAYVVKSWKQHISSISGVFLQSFSVQTNTVWLKLSSISRVAKSHLSPWTPIGAHTSFESGQASSDLPHVFKKVCALHT